VRLKSAGRRKKTAENTEECCDGHNQAGAYFDGVPRTILYGNTRIAVKEIIICSRPSMRALERPVGDKCLS
jgi:transposase